MFKTVVFAAFLACSFGAAANDWQRDLFSPLSNELPPSRGVAVDDQGYVHLQAYNRFPGSADYFLAHQYTIAAQGHTPWIWGLSQVDRMSDCGVFAKSGQRLDCTRRNGYWGEETRLEMRGNNHSYAMWESVLPSEVTLLNASIPQPNEALVLGRIDQPSGAELGVFRANSYAPAEVLSVAPACPQQGQTLLTLRARMPKQSWERLRVVKACWNSFGTTDVIVEEFDTLAQQWSALATWPAPFDASVAQAAINADGKAFVVLQHESGLRELLASGVYGDMWLPMPLPGDTAISAFLANERALAIVLDSADPNAVGSDNVLWFDLMGGFWPQFMPSPTLANIDAQRYALSSEGHLLVLGREAAQNTDQLWAFDRYGQQHTIAALPLAANESVVGAPYLVGGPNHVATIARTIAQDDGHGGGYTGVRVNQYDVPM